MKDKITNSDIKLSVDLDAFCHFSRQYLSVLGALKTLGFHEKEVKNGVSKISPFSEYYEIHYSNDKRRIVFFLFTGAGGQYIVSVFKTAKDNENIFFDLEKFNKKYDLNYEKNSQCFKLSNQAGELEERVKKAISCIGTILEGSVSSVLEGKTWIDVPPPSFFDYK